MPYTDETVNNLIINVLTNSQYDSITTPSDTELYLITDDPAPIANVKVNGTSIVSNGEANLVTNTAYNASSNKIATMSDVPTVTSTYSSTGTNAVNGAAVNAALQTLDSYITAETGKAISAFTITDGTISAATKIAVGDANQNAFSNVKVGSSTIAADTTTDTLELVAGSNITLTPDTTNDKVTIAFNNASGYTTNTGTVTSVGITNGGGLSVSGSPITTSGSITVGHSNSVTAQTTQAVYPIKIDANGHISAYGSAVTIPTVTSSYSSTGTDAVNGTAVNAALQTLDSSISATSGQAISAITITDGKIASSSKISVGETNQNAFSNVKVGSSTIAADSKTDTLELVASTGVILTPDTTNDKVTISAGNVSHNDSASAGSATPINADQLQGYTLTTLTNTIKTSILNTIYPIGSVYMNVSNTNPGTLFGGTWELVSNVALASNAVFGNGKAMAMTDGSSKWGLRGSVYNSQSLVNGNTNVYGQNLSTSGTSGGTWILNGNIGSPTKTQLGSNLDYSGLITDTITLYTWRRTE